MIITKHVLQTMPLYTIISLRRVFLEAASFLKSCHKEYDRSWTLLSQYIEYTTVMKFYKPNLKFVRTYLYLEIWLRGAIRALFICIACIVRLSTWVNYLAYDNNSTIHSNIGLERPLSLLTSWCASLLPPPSSVRRLSRWTTDNIKQVQVQSQSQ